MIWTMLRCDYTADGRCCQRKFRTTYAGQSAVSEAKTYGWSVTELGVRCPDHRDMASVVPAKEDE